jgi:hypothetical protein
VAEWGYFEMTAGRRESPEKKSVKQSTMLCVKLAFGDELRRMLFLFSNVSANIAVAIFRVNMLAWHLLEALYRTGSGNL